jgi:glucosyl-dolichyl phosphate glucuronosyltransferase
VDNNSSDRTREVVEQFSRPAGSPFRYLFEPQQGKSNALNSGIREAHGNILAFTDDDVTVEPDWLQNLTSNLRSNEWAGAAGRVVRTWPCPSPRWLSLESRYEKMGWALVSFELDQEAGDLSDRCPPVGANMAYRKEVLAKHGGFRADLGPQGNEIDSPSTPGPTKSKSLNGRNRKAVVRFPGWEDSELGQRLMSRGERLRYEPSAVVYHPVAEGRLTKKYFLTWWFSRGRDGVLIAPERGPVWGIPRRYIRIARITFQLLGNLLKWLLAFKPYQRFYYQLMVWEKAGEMIGGYQLWFKMPKRIQRSAEPNEQTSAAHR